MVLFLNTSISYAKDTELSGFFAVGIAMTPDFEGSDDYHSVPFVVSQLHSGRINLEFEGLGGRLHLKPPSWYEAGLSFNYRFGRDNSIKNSVIGQLSEVDDAIEAGAFFRIELDDQWRAQDSLEFKAEVLSDTSGVHDGNIATLSTSYLFFAGQHLRYQIGAETTYADNGYINTYFGVNSSDSQLSGLPQYNARGGFKDIALSLNATYFLSKNIGVLGRIGYKRLIGDASKSPIIEEQGDTKQMFGGISVLYQF